MTSIEQSGRSVEEAIGAALARLNTTRDRVDVEVLAETPRRFLGLGGPGSARVRVTLRPAGVLGGMAPAEAEDLAGDAQPAATGPADQPSEEEAESEEAAAEFGERARAVTQHVLDLMGLDLEATVTGGDRHHVDIEVEGPDTRIIIGKHGQTLEALQHLVGLIVNKESRRHRRVMVDAEAYQQRRRERRERELLEMVRADAERARESGQEAVIQYAVGPYERRLVHMAFKDDPDFITYSEGEEPHRYVVVSPRD